MTSTSTLPDFWQGPAANDMPPLRAMTVQIKKGATVVRRFEVMAVDTLSAAAQHEDLCGEGEYVRVLPYRVLPPQPDYGSYGMRCSLCGDRSDRFTCASCNEHLTKNGGKL